MSTADQTPAPASITALPRGFVLTDNGGRTHDRYTLLCTRPEEHWGRKYYTYLGMSANPYSPQGFGQHGELSEADVLGHKQTRYRQLGKRITLADLPEEARRAAESFVSDFTKI
jgi:hypothetical protein